MSWVFAAEVGKDQTVVVECLGGALTLTGSARPELAASAEPADLVDRADELRLVFDDDAQLLVPAGVAALRVQRCEGNLRATSLACGLDVRAVEGDVDVADHQGSFVLHSAVGDLCMSACSGGADIRSLAGDAALQTGSGGARVRW